MRSSATSGLTSQQLLDRRRAQNKLAQRRFREKARLARATGSDSPRPLGFPAHLDLTHTSALHHGQGRGRSASSDSVCSSSSVSLSSQVSSPTSSCTELNTPVMPTFSDLAQPRMAKANMFAEPPRLVIHESQAEQDWSNMPPPMFPHSYASYDPSLVPSVPFGLAPSSVTYSNLARSSVSSCDIGLKIVGMHSDPFLMSQPLPSPALLVPPPPTSQSLTASSISLPQSMVQQDSAACFDYLLRIPSSPLTSSHGDVASATVVDLSSSMRFDRTISEHVARAHADPDKNSRPTRSMAISSLPFARVVETIASRFGMAEGSEGLPQLLSRLELYTKTGTDNSDGSKGLVFDASVNWESLSINMLPTTEQLLYPHRAFLDVCLPWPAVRSRLVKQALVHPVCEEELALDLLLSILATDESVAAFHVYGDDVLDPEAYELSERMLHKWWGLFDDSIVHRTNWWRRQRGLAELSLPQRLDSSNEFERQGLGTGSLDQAHRLASTLLQ